MLTYVLIFMFSEKLDQVLLLLKSHPEFLAGKYNGLGGVVQSNEALLDAVAREWREESGRSLLELVQAPFQFHRFGEAFHCHCFAGSFRGDLRAFNFTGKPDEPVCVFQVDRLPENIAQDTWQLVHEARRVLCPTK